MRKCIRCETEMLENCNIKQEASISGLRITGSNNIWAKSENPKAALCPHCGEVSLYVENAASLFK